MTISLTDPFTGNWSTHDSYHADGNGNITYLEDSSQGLAASYRYDAYGNLLSSSGPLVGVNTYQFSSKEYIPTAGFYYYLYRFYDAGSQRWINRDPVAERGFALMRGHRNAEPGHGVNSYEFVLNNPCLFEDPEGLTVWVCSRKTDWGIGNHVYFYDDDPEDGPSQSCSQQASSGGRGTVSGNDVSPSENPNCTPVEGTGDPGETNGKGQSIMGCCKQTANSGPYIPFADDCHNHLNNCLGAGGGYNPIRHPRFGPPRVSPVFDPLPSVQTGLGQ